MSGPLSVCILCTFYPPAAFGGDAVHAQRLAHGLADRGHRVRVVHNPSAYRMLGGVEPDDVAGHRGVEVLSYPDGPIARGRTAATYLAGRPLGYRGRLQDAVAGADVVVFNNPSLMGGPGAFGIGGPDAIRLYTAHEHWLVCPTHTLFRYGREVCTRRTCWRCCASYGRIPQPWRSTSLLERSLSDVDAVLVPSRFTAALHRQALPGVRVEVVPSLGLPSPDLVTCVGTSPVDNHSGERPFFLFAGRVEAIKGPLPLARAFSRVRGADLVIAGDGSQSAELAIVAAGNPAIRLLGRRPLEHVIDLARRATAVVVPSMGYETFGLAAVEAMAQGTPVVVRALGPLPELVEHGGGVAVADDEAMMEVLQTLADHPGEARRMGVEAAEVAARYFSVDAVFGRWFRVLAHVAEARGLARVAAAASAAAEPR